VKEKINTKKVIKYWLESSKQNFETAKFLFKGKKYSDSLFFCHLMLEKILKALVVQKTKTHAPYTHQLVDLAKIAKIQIGTRFARALSPFGHPALSKT
jgi:HEPN domain-containing protein